MDVNLFFFLSVILSFNATINHLLSFLSFLFFFSALYSLSLPHSPLSLIGGDTHTHFTSFTPNPIWIMMTGFEVKMMKRKKTIIMESGGKNAGHELPCLRQLLFCSLVEGALMPTCVALWHGTWTWRKAVGGSLWLWQCCRQRKHWHLGRKWLYLFVSLPHSPLHFLSPLLHYSVCNSFCLSLVFFFFSFYVRN